MTTEAFKNNFPEALERKIKETRTVQAELARRCKRKPQAVTKWLKGKGPGIDTLKLIAKFYDSDFSKLQETGHFMPVMATYTGNLSKMAMEIAQSFDGLPADEQIHIAWLIGRLKKGTKTKIPEQRARRVSRVR